MLLNKNTKEYFSICGRIYICLDGEWISITDTSAHDLHFNYKIFRCSLQPLPTELRLNSATLVFFISNNIIKNADRLMIASPAAPCSMRRN